nr:hypothetical protein [Geodermatophilus africanus]
MARPIEGTPAGKSVAAQDSAGLGGVVAGGQRRAHATAVAVCGPRMTRTPSS